MNTEERLALYCYNNAHLLPEILNGIAIKEGAWQCIVVDDGSTDNSAVIIKKFVDGDERFRYVFQQHQGREVALATVRHVYGHDDVKLLEAEL